MTRFAYTAVAPDGTEVKGTVAAPNGASARSNLTGRDLRVVELVERRSPLQIDIGKRKVPRAEIMHLSRQLAAFVRAGVPILEAISVIEQEASNSRLRETLRGIDEALRRGERFSDAVGAYRSIFPPYYTDMLRSAELTGRLDTVLDQLARYIERDLEARRKIQGALAYPAIIFVMSIVTVTILTAFVLPRFQKFFESLDATLPLPTRALLATSGAIGRFWWAILGSAIVVIGGGALFLKKPRGKEIRDRFLLRLPLAGDVVRFAVIERFCRILASMAQAGVPLPDGLVLAAEGTGNVVYDKGVHAMREAIIKGEGIARPMARTNLFPPSVVQMVRVGEDTGTLDQQLETAGNYYQQELDYKIKRLTSYFEPFVIAAMGILVGFVALALISAMYGIFNQAGRLQ
ncbi:MAG: type II secretion system F family protein [Acidobacteria bacterium]|nr:type II secretion system F family protein [Acidobacteriota bacterium]